MAKARITKCSWEIAGVAAGTAWSLSGARREIEAARLRTGYVPAVIRVFRADGTWNDITF